MRRLCLVVLMQNTHSRSGRIPTATIETTCLTGKPLSESQRLFSEAQFGEEQIKTQGPLLADESNKDFWIV